MRVAIVIVIACLLMTALLCLARLLGGSHCYDPHTLARVHIASLGAKIESFALDAGRPPVALNELVDGPFVDQLGAYAKPAELRDPWGAPYYYRPDADGTFALFTLGADGRLGGDGPDRDVQYRAEALPQ